MRTRVLVCLLTIVTACMQSGCGRAKPVLQVCGPTELIKPTLIDRFEKESNCTVAYNPVASDDEALVALKEGEQDVARAVVMDGLRSGASIESETVNNYLEKNAAIVTPTSNAAYLRLREKYPELKFAIPWEGTILSFEEAVISADTGSPELAQSFVNFLHDPEVAVENSEYARMLCPNEPSYRHLSRKIQGDSAMILPAEILARSESLSPLGDAEADYLAAWDELRAIR